MANIFYVLFPTLLILFIIMMQTTTQERKFQLLKEVLPLILEAKLTISYFEGREDYRFDKKELEAVYQELEDVYQRIKNMKFNYV
jgi:hypothetical protein